MTNKVGFDALFAICNEIACDKRVDLVDSERRIRLYHALDLATGGGWSGSSPSPTEQTGGDPYVEPIQKDEPPCCKWCGKDLYEGVPEGVKPVWAHKGTGSRHCDNMIGHTARPR